MKHIIQSWIVRICVLCIIWNLSSLSGFAQERVEDVIPRGGNIGLGIVLGDPTGLTAKFWMDNKHAIDGGVAYSFGDYILVYSDYLWHFPKAFAGKESSSFVQQLTPYVGPGGEVFFSTGTPSLSRRFFEGHTTYFGLGFRIVGGIEWTPADPPLGVFIEIAPGIGIIPRTFAFLQAGIGCRWYF